MKKKISFLVVCVLFFLPVAYAFAHPHVFISNRFSVIFDKTGLTGIEIHWVFDKMFSAVMIGDYDKNKNGIFEKEEIKSLENEAFSDIKEYGYFVSIHINDEPFKVTRIKNFSASIKDKAMSYRFTIPCSVKSNKKRNEIVAASYDPTYYIAIGIPEKDAIRLVGSENYKIQKSIEKSKKINYPNAMGSPSAMILTFESK